MASPKVADSTALPYYDMKLLLAKLRRPAVAISRFKHAHRYLNLVAYSLQLVVNLSILTQKDRVHFTTWLSNNSISFLLLLFYKFLFDKELLEVLQNDYWQSETTKLNTFPKAKLGPYALWPVLNFSSTWHASIRWCQILSTCLY